MINIGSQALLDLKSQLNDVKIKQDQMDISLKQLISNNSPQSEKKDDKRRDRTRLKERLKKATLTGSNQMVQLDTNWLESIFGITHGDRRDAKRRSRLKIFVPESSIMTENDRLPPPHTSSHPSQPHPPAFALHARYCPPSFSFAPMMHCWHRIEHARAKVARPPTRVE